MFSSLQPVSFLPCEAVGYPAFGKLNKKIHIMGQKWKYLPPTEEQAAVAKTLSAELDMSPVLCSLLVKRGITSVAEARSFFRPKLSHLHNPFLMKDMDIAVKRLNKALGKKERILVYGDYDVDGTTAVALVYKFLQQFSSNIDYYIPDRNEDGYGISKRGVDYAYSTGVKLVIVLDCGIKAIEEIAYKNGWISKEKLLESAERYGNSSYGEHLKKVAKGQIMY